MMVALKLIRALFPSQFFFFVFLDEHMISLHVKVGAQLIKAKAQSIDQQYGISEKAALVGQAATAVKDTAVQKMHEIDESLKISDKAASIAQSVGQTFSGIASVAMQNENIAKGISVIQGVGSTVTGAIKERVEREKMDIERAIQEKQKQVQLEKQQQQQQPQQQQQQATETKADSQEKATMDATLSNGTLPSAPEVITLPSGSATADGPPTSPTPN